jgi:cysteinyl-tRNA synthetase
MHRVDPDPRKRNVTDFALWKSQKPGEPAWNSPWGKGRPGWHIEDTAITMTYFGASYDLHGGGLDLIFPHHEAEIAQAEAATGRKPLVKYWIHGGLLTVSGSRMGKSIGNFITIKDALLTHEAESLRLYFAMSHYRSQLEYSESGIEQAEQALEKLRSVYYQFRRAFDESKTANTPPETVVEIRKITSMARSNFDEAMDDDFNTPRALAAIIAYAKEISPYAGTELNKETVAEIVEMFDYFRTVFGVLESKPALLDTAFEKLLKLLLEVRDEARKTGDWKTSDTIRRSLVDMGVIVEDTATGPRWHIKPVSKSSG